jgi:hypothetical protein
MARQKGIFRFTGSIGGLTYYRLYREWLVRQKSSLDRERVTRDPAFARSRVAARRFGVAARIAGSVYRVLPARKKRHGLIGRLTGLANTFLFAGDTEEVVREKLLRHVLGPAGREKF